MDGYVYKTESLGESNYHEGVFYTNIEYIIHERIKSEDFYNKYYPKTLSVRANDNDCGDYEIDGYDYIDINKVNVRDVYLYEQIHEFDKIQNRIDNIDEVLK